MKKILMAMLCSVVSTFAFGQIDSVIVEKFYVSNATDAAGSVGALPTGSITWRFYVDLASGYELQAVYGNALHQLRFQTSTGFFNNEDRGAQTANAIGFTYLSSNSVMLDSYISVGGTCSNRLGLLKSEDDAVSTVTHSGGLLANTDPSIGFPITTRDGQLATASTLDAVTAVNISTELGVFDNVSNAGNLFSTNNGSWANLNGSEGPTATNRVLIAQITTDGVLNYALNLQVRNIATLQVYNYVSSSPGSGELTHPSLSGTLNQPNTLPTVSVTAPTTGATYFVGNTVNITANAADADGSVSNVEFLVDGAVVGTDNTSPYSFNWTATQGSHSITARATDNQGGQTTSTGVSITVGIVVPPTVSITSPAGGATFVLSSTPITISATAADADGTVSSVQFLVDGAVVGTDNTAPYSFNWTATVGNKTLTAIATDNSNATTTSAPVSISVFDSSSAYAVVSGSGDCSQSSFCIPIQALIPVDNVIGYDMSITYDAAEVTPTGVVTIDNDLINPSYVSYATSSGGSGVLNISVYLNGTAPITAEFNGTGRLLCVEFAKLAGFAAIDTTPVAVSVLSESYINGVTPKVVSPGDYRSTVSTTFASELRFWGDNSPIKYNSGNTSQYNITNIYGNNTNCNATSVTAVQPDLAGTFNFNTTNGSQLEIKRDISNTSSVQSVVNGFDAFLAKRVLTNDVNFIPSVYQIIALDVNTDGVVSAGDLSQINQRAVLALGEFRQDWNYNASGISNGQPSKDWLFVDGTTLGNNSAYQISSTYPASDGIGYSKYKVPTVSFCSPIPVFNSGNCQSFGSETYTGILLGDVNGNWATANTANTIRSSQNSKIILNLSKAKINGNQISIPVFAQSDDAIHSMDLGMQYNTTKLAFNDVTNNNPGMEMLSNEFNKVVRITSFSMDNYNVAAPVAFVNFIGSNINASDLSGIEAYINGEPVNYQLRDALENSNGIEVNVFPNPAKDLINLSVSENSAYQLMDMNGKVLVGADNLNAFEGYQIPTNSISNGVYMLKVYNSGSVKTTRVVIQK